MPQVFGCPNCQNPFQVPDNAAGQEFQCPSCKSAVQVPAEAPKPAAAPEVFACPHCNGQFGINASMYGQELACPHCKRLVAIGEVPDQVIAPPVINEKVESKEQTEEPEFQIVEESAKVSAGKKAGKSRAASKSRTAPTPEPAAEPEALTADDQTDPETEQAEEAPLPDRVFEPQPVDHLLPPRFDVPDPARFPSRRGEEVILPDGAGGYQSVDANIVTITHNGEVYHLKRLTPEQRQRRRLIHNTIAICVAVVLIYLTLRTLGLVS